ncbi:MAG: hypothetical protein CL846_10425 [Crocinitomicaceae bacterium]|nr:hypothetical protein [Crocinitomicaceae bacterium]
MKYLTIYILLLSAFSCRKPENRRCWKGSGQINAIIQSHDESINKLIIYDDINLKLVNDSLNYCEIIGPSNLIKLVHIIENNNAITIENHNSCKFLRANKEINVFFHYTDLKTIHLNGFGKLSNEKEIIHPIEIKAENVLSNIDLLINNDSTNILISRGSTETKLRGNCENLYIYNSGLAPIKTLSLSSINVHIHSNTITKTEINVNGKLNAEIRSSGDIYYSGNPTSIKSTITGSGKIIEI